jgi:Arrestin (or S-antigen), N-terminal domain
MSDAWSLTLDPGVLLPGKTARATLTYHPPRDVTARSVRARLRCIERWRYDTREATTTGQGVTSSRTVTRTGEAELHRAEWQLAGETRLVAGQPESWSFEIEVPPLGPASFEGEELRCDWTLQATVDRKLAADDTATFAIHLAQPMALLRAGVVETGMYGLYEEAPANLDALPAQIRLEPVPINLQAEFRGAFTVQTAEPLQLQEVRLELRVAVEATVPGGRHEEILAARGRLDSDAGSFGGALDSHSFVVDAPRVWLPSIDLPHGRARATFHVILARAWARDDHYLRDVALATTDAL